jgi:hypothetical protein
VNVPTIVVAVLPVMGKMTVVGCDTVAGVLDEHSRDEHRTGRIDGRAAENRSSCHRDRGGRDGRDASCGSTIFVVSAVDDFGSAKPWIAEQTLHEGVHVLDGKLHRHIAARVAPGVDEIIDLTSGVDLVRDLIRRREAESIRGTTDFLETGFDGATPKEVSLATRSAVVLLSAIS